METTERKVPRLIEPLRDGDQLAIQTVTDGETIEEVDRKVERRGPTTHEAAEMMRAYAKEFARPTIAALATLEETVRACRKTLETDLERMEHQSQAFAERNEAAQHCLEICIQAVKQLVDKTPA